MYSWDHTDRGDKHILKWYSFSQLLDGVKSSRGGVWEGLFHIIYMHENHIRNVKQQQQMKINVQKFLFVKHYIYCHSKYNKVTIDFVIFNC